MSPLTHGPDAKCIIFGQNYISIMANEKFHTFPITYIIFAQIKWICAIIKLRQQKINSFSISVLAP